MAVLLARTLGLLLSGPWAVRRGKFTAPAGGLEKILVFSLRDLTRRAG
jgi:hypothetical protein